MPASRNQIDPVFPLALLQRDCFTGRATCFFPFPSSEPHTHTHTHTRARARGASEARVFCKESRETETRPNSLRRRFAAVG